MVVTVNDLYECEVCHFRYRDRETAEECEQFCREHNACDPDIITEAVERSEEVS